MNEWKICFFFRFIFFFRPKNRMNEWYLNFSVEKKKKNKKTHKNSEKKNASNLLKKKETSSKSDWMTDELFLRKKKKKQLYFFFPLTIFGFEWMNDQRPCPRKKKIRYLWLETGFKKWNAEMGFVQPLYFNRCRIRVFLKLSWLLLSNIFLKNKSW